MTTEQTLNRKVDPSSPLGNCILEAADPTTKLYEIKSWLTGQVMFSLECDSLKLCVEAAVRAQVSLSYANLRYANLVSADLRYANFRYANFRYANFRYANLEYANLEYANLVSADLRYANLVSANLGSANLGSANLGSADLRYANFRYANLGYANLGSANLEYANLVSADLRYANLGYVKIIQGPTRSDGYQFLLTCLKSEGWRVKAGCRNFTIDEARSHWATAHAGTPLQAESLVILDCLFALAKSRGFDLTKTEDAT